MIKVIYYKAMNRVTIKGHALSGVPGHDLVCAGASTLAYTLAANVGRMEDMYLVDDALVVLEPGSAEIRCVTGRECSAIVETIFDTVCVGFELLARDNPQYISYEIRK